MLPPAEPAAGESMLLALCRLCVVGLSLTGAALVLLSSAGLDRVVAATDGTAAAAEDLQFDLGEGPPGSTQPGPDRCLPRI